MTPLATPETGGSYGMLEGESDPEGGAGNAGIPQGLAHHPISAERTTPMVDGNRTTVHRNPLDRRWQVACPCGFTWRSRWHRLALLMAVNHHHEAA